MIKEMKKMHFTKKYVKQIDQENLFIFYNLNKIASKQFKGTVSISSSDLAYEDDSARFTTVPLKPFLLHNVANIVVL